MVIHIHYWNLVAPEHIEMMPNMPQIQMEDYILRTIKESNSDTACVNFHTYSDLPFLILRMLSAEQTITETVEIYLNFESVGVIGTKGKLSGDCPRELFGPKASMCGRLVRSTGRL